MMESFVIVNPGMEEVARQELNELIDVRAEVSPSVLAFEAKKKEDLLVLAYRSQSIHRLLVSLGRYTDIPSTLPHISWSDFFSPDYPFSVDIEHVKEEEKRNVITGKLIGQIVTTVEKSCGFTPKVEWKKPGISVVVHYTGREYIVGIDICGRELDKRHYRVFPHTASMRGDLAYYCVRASAFRQGDTLLVGFVKDGTLAIEAALFANKQLIHPRESSFAFRRFPLFMNVDYVSFFKELLSKQSAQRINAFDDSRQNVIAARKNIAIAGQQETITLNMYDIEELDVKYEKEQFHRLIFHITKREEKHIKELFYQATFLWKQEGTLLLISRPGFTLTVPEEFALRKKTTIRKGEHEYQLLLIEKVS
jgi:23S rRNA G2445 N2-methylase RlmL